MPINRYFKLYLNAGRSIPMVINANQNDKDEQWYFSLFTETGEQYFPDAGAIVGIKCDGKLIDNEATVDSRGYVIVTETAQMTAVPGKNIFELQLNEHTHGTANFIVLVEPSPTNGGVLSDSDLSLFQQAINSIAIAGSGAPAVATLASEMTDQGKIYLYAGSETGYTAGDWYYYNGSAWTDGGKYGGTVDSTLTIPGAAADSAKVGQEISDLKSQIEQSGGLTSAIKSALMQLANNVAFKNTSGQSYIDDLYDALYPPIVYTAITLDKNSLSFGSLNSTQQLTATTTPRGGEVTWTSSNPSVATVSQTGLVTAIAYGNATITASCGSLTAQCSVAITQATVTSISAVYAQGSKIVYDTDSLDSLKDDLTVTATWSNQTTSTVAGADYTLSGTLTEGTSTITVSYGGQTATFTVTVTERGALYPLENGTWDSETTNPIYRITVSNGNHVKFESLRGVSQQAFADLHNGGISASPNIVNNLSELFVIPANTETTLTISNVVNSGNVSFNCNFRKANASTSSSFGIGDGAHTDGATVTKTLDADESIGCLFFYHPQAVAVAGSVIEFDVSLTVGGTKYI